MNCPDCEVEMEYEKHEGERKGSDSTFWCVEYFCLVCHGYFIWTKGIPLTEIGQTGVADTLARYRNGEADEQGQVWD